jgi:hypothetical protein
MKNMNKYWQVAGAVAVVLGLSSAASASDDLDTHQWGGRNAGDGSAFIDAGSRHDAIVFDIEKFRLIPLTKDQAIRGSLPRFPGQPGWTDPPPPDVRHGFNQRGGLR